MVLWNLSSKILFMSPNKHWDENDPKKILMNVSWYFFYKRRQDIKKIKTLVYSLGGIYENCFDAYHSLQ